MDAILFGLKRADQVAIRFGREVLAPYGLTPARFDMLFAVGTHTTRQSSLRRLLGVARSTTSRMLRALERLGWVRRGPRWRTRAVELTDSGRALLRRAAKRLCGPRSLPFRRVADGIRLRPKSHDFVARGELDGVLSTFRRRLGDLATLDYPWYEDH